MAQYLLGIDCGSTMVKAALYDVAGKEIAVAGRKQDVRSPQPSWRELDPELVWTAAVGAIAEVLARAGIQGREVSAIGATGYGNGVYMLDRDWQPVRPAFQSSDIRATDIIERWTAEGVPQKIAPNCFQAVFPGEMATCLAWVKAHEPAAYARIAHISSIKNYVSLRLSGVLANDVSDMSGTGLLDKDYVYRQELFELYGIPEMWGAVPPLKPSHEVIGGVTAEAAAATGLLAGTPVVTGLHDMSACPVACGAIHEGDIVATIGTLNINVVIVEHPPASGVGILGYAVAPYYLASSGGGSSALNLEWFVTTCCGDERALAKERGMSVYEVCNELVESVPLVGQGVMYHPWLLTKRWLPNSTAGFYGLTSTTSKAQMLRALYEGVMFGHLDGLRMIEAAGFKGRELYLSGGGSRSRVWSQMFADAYGLPAIVAAGAEHGAHGAAMCAGIGAGVYRDYGDAVARAVTVERTQAPQPEWAALYARRHAEFTGLSQAMLEPWKGLAELRAKG